MSPIRVRPAELKDLSRLVEFQLCMAWETESLRLDVDTLRSGVAAVFDDPTKGQYVVAEEDAHIVGCLLLTYEWSDWRNGRILWIQSVYVVPHARRKGVFRALYQFVQQLARQPPNVGVRLYVDVRNKSAQLVYQKLGMRGDHYQVWEWFPRVADCR